MKIALGQLSSCESIETNLNKMKTGVVAAAKEHAQWVGFPEMAYLMGSKATWQPTLPRFAEIKAALCDWAKMARIGILAGSLREPVPGVSDKFFNTALAIDASGTVVASYRKIFLFQADLPDRVYYEAEFCQPGDSLAVFETHGVKMGLAICFDLRFPELFRALKSKGAQLIWLPSAFTVPTGRDHWEVLLRARAIENQCFVAAPAQVGKVGEGKETYGHSLVVSPWGEKILELSGGEQVGHCELRMEEIEKAQGKVNGWGSIRPDLFPFSLA